MPTNQPFELVLGEETDARLFRALQSAITSMSGTMVESSYGVGGSQELIEYTITLPTGVVQLTFETYIGLTLRGPQPIVQSIAEALHRQC
jgi:hypothetical protein